MKKIRKPEKNGKPQKGISLPAFLLYGLFLVMLLAGACITGVKLVEYTRAGQTYSGLQEEIRSQSPDIRQEAVEAEDGKGGYDVDFDILKQKNPDMVAWIRCEGAGIDYPILLGEDNDFYLHHLYTGERNGSGSIFMDYRNKGDFSDQNTVIYGHNMRNHTMFGNLDQYKKQTFYDANPTMEILTPEGCYTLEIICGTVEDGNAEFVRFGWQSDEERKDYIQGLTGRSCFQSDVTLMPGDRLVTLCTCSYEGDNTRFMLVGRLVEL